MNRKIRSKGGMVEFLQWGKHHPDFNFETGSGYLDGLVQWAVKHNRGTRESILKEAFQGMVAQGSRTISAHEPRDSLGHA